MRGQPWIVVSLWLGLCACSASSRLEFADAGDSGAGGTSGGGGASGTGSGGKAGAGDGGSGQGGSGPGGGGSGTGGGGGSGGASAGTDCRAEATAQCARLAACFPYLIAIGSGSEANCVADSIANCEISTTAPGASIRDSAACVAEVNEVSCDQLINGTGLRNCYTPGTRAADAPCMFGGQCASGTCQLDATGCGVCAFAAGPNQSCSGVPCEPGLHCSPGLTCVIPSDVGGGCDIGGLPCRLPYVCAGGVCRDPLPLGAPCVPAEASCDSLQGHYCATDPNGQGQCTAMSIVGPDEECGLVGSVVVQCRGDSWCNGAACALRPEPGQPCDPASNPVCRGGASCTGGTCQLPTPASCE